MTVRSQSARELGVVIAEYEPLTPMDAADLMGWQYERTYHALRVLQGEGLVKLEANRRYRVTEKGRRELDVAIQKTEEG